MKAIKKISAVLLAGATATVKATLGTITSITAQKCKLNSQTGKYEYYDTIASTTVQEGKEYTFVMPADSGVHVKATGTTSL